MRMARVNITVPDELVAEAKERGWNISRMTMEALRAEVDKQRKIDELGRYLAELDEQLGPSTPEEVAAAEAWVNRVLGPETAGDQRRQSA